MITIEHNKIEIILQETTSLNVAIQPPPDIDVDINNVTWQAPAIQYYTHYQNTYANEWTVNHNLGKYPQVTVLSNGLQEFIASVVHINQNQLKIYTNEETRGIAICQ